MTLTAHLTGLGITFLCRFFFIQGKLKLGKEMQVGARQWETTPSDVISVLPSYLKGDEGLRKILLIRNGFILKLHIKISVPEPEQNVREFWLIFFHKNIKRGKRNPYLTTAKINSLKLKMCMINKTRIVSLYVQKDPWNSVAMIGRLFCLWGQCSVPHPLVHPAGMWTNTGRDFVIYLCLLDAKMEMRLVVHRRVHNGVCKHSHSHYFLCRNLHWWSLEALPLFNLQCPEFLFHHYRPVVFPFHYCGSTSSQWMPVVTSYLSNHQRRGRKRGRSSGRSSALFCYKSSRFCRSQVWFTACQGKYLDCPQLDLISTDAFCLLPESQHKAAVEGFQMQSTLSLLSY